MSRAILRRGRPIGVLALGCLLLAGCSGSERVPAVFTLPDRPTLVLVDDPADRFGDPNLAMTVAFNIEHHWKTNGVLAGRIVPASRVTEMQRRLGSEQFRNVPMDRVGRELGAEQVVYVLIDDVSLEQAPGMFRPRAEAQVKVIDATTGKRLFPDPPAPNQPPEDRPIRGHRIVTEMRYQGSDAKSYGAMTQMKRQLAEVLARDVARQFYRWKPPEIGSRFDEP